MSTKLFITGTDTEVGKTYISTGILRAFNKKNYETIGLKPIASGIDIVKGSAYNRDGTLLQEAASIKLDYKDVNPYLFDSPIAPHIAAKKEDTNLYCMDVLKKIEAIYQYPADYFVIEGVGGWEVPLNDKESMPDLVKQLNVPVILVVAIKLGCLNHAILTAKAIRQANIPLAGWVANCISPTQLAIEENIETLKNRMPAPCLGIVPFNALPENYLEM